MADNAGSQDSVTLNQRLQNLNLFYSSERNQAIQTLGVGAAIMGVGAMTEKSGIFVVGLIVVLFGYARYSRAMKTGAERDALGYQLIATSQVRV
jgi:hypothetical protein